jgi:hypothetical protein
VLKWTELISSMVVYRRQLLEPNTYVMHLCNNSAFDGDSSASYLAIDYKYKGDMKKRSAIIDRILTTDIHLQQLNAENRAGVDVPDATDITISKRKWETACLLFRKHLRDFYRRQLAADLVSPGLWDLECGEW